MEIIGHSKKYIYIYNIDIGHFSRKLKIIPNKVTLQEILVKNSTYTNISSLKKKLLAANLLKNECSICGLSDTWQKKPIKMILDHINGVHNDHSITNIRFVCPNCNSQLPTNCGKNIKNKRLNKICKRCGKVIDYRNESELCIKCYHEDRRIKALLSKRKPKKNCEICKASIWNGRHCVSCSEKIRRKVERPSKENLLVLIENKPMLEIATIYKVSSNTIKKWCVSYGIILGNRRGYWAKKYSIDRVVTAQSPKL